MGGKGQGERGESAALARELADVGRRQVGLAEEQAAITRPIRQQTAGIFDTFLKSGQTPAFLDLPSTVQPLAALSLPALGFEQNRLKDELMAQGSRGGLLRQQLGQVSLQGSLQRAGLLQQDILRQEERDLARAALRQRLFGGASDIGTGGLSLAFQGLGQGGQSIGGAGQQFGALGQQEMAKGTGISGQVLGAVGTGLGAYAALK